MTPEIPPDALVGTFTVDGEPVSKARARFSTYKGKVRTYTPEKTITGESRVREAFLADHPENADDANTTFGVVCVFYCGTRQRRDVDNMVKLVLDGLNETAWKDDNQVLEILGRKTFVPKAEARTEVTVYRIGSMDYLSKPCEHCGESFRTWESLKDTTRFCSPACRAASRLAARRTECDNCGSVFTRHAKTHETRFCSRACKTEAGRVTLEREVCGQAYTKQSSYVRVRSFCSTACRDKGTAVKRARQAGGTCEDCGGSTSKKIYAKCFRCRAASQARTTGDIRPTTIHINLEEA